MARPGRTLLLVGAGLFGLLLVGGAAVELYTEALWFHSLDKLGVFWTRVGAGLGVRFVAGAAAAAFVALNLWFVARRLGPVQLRRRYGNLEIAEQVPRRMVTGGIGVAAFLAGWWLSGLGFGGTDALSILAWIRQVEWGIDDPLFGRDLSFFVFSLPVYFRVVDFLLVTVLWSSALVLLGYVLAGAIRWTARRIELQEEVRLHFVTLGAIVVLLLALRYWFGRYGLLLDGTGIGGGMGYTDVRARLPAHRTLALLAVLSAGALLYGAWRRSWVPPGIGLGVLALAALSLGQLYPAFIQKFQVEPNQLAMEAPYIRWNMEFTRRAYGLEELERRPFPYRIGEVPAWESLEPMLGRLSLWDEEPLRTTFNQVEAIFGYYHFHDVDSDRYGVQGAARQVAIGVREFNIRGLAESARTWQTLRLNPQYLRGVGVVVSPMAETNRIGEARRWIRNLDPVVRDTAAPIELDLMDASVYFGETMGLPGGGQEYVILIPGRDSALLGEPGIDFPAGIRLGTLPRLMAFAWRFRDKNLLFSGELTDDSRILFRRSLLDRVRAIAPFLVWDPDAHPVVIDGSIAWIVDGYVASTTFPLARTMQIPNSRGVARYLRSSVKAVVDARTGAVTLYQVGTEDPVLETYRRVFADLIRPAAEMPPTLRAHLRYPEQFLLAQAEILKEYHLNRPEPFYAGQDLWQLPQRIDRSGVEAYRPIYAMMRLPGEAASEFLVSVPFIARERQNMTALLVARNEASNYGRLVLLDLPRDQQIPGPTQVGALMEQDPVISPQLSLWRQAGSTVDLGRLRVVPLDSAFLYVQPIFLSARESSIPELARVVVSDGRAVAMAPSLAEAVRGIRTPGARRDPDESEADAASDVASDAASDDATPDAWQRRALELLDQAEGRLRAGDWAGFGATWAELRRLLGGVPAQRPR